MRVKDVSPGPPGMMYGGVGFGRRSAQLASNGATIAETASERIDFGAARFAMVTSRIVAAEFRYVGAPSGATSAAQRKGGEVAPAALSAKGVNKTKTAGSPPPSMIVQADETDLPVHDRREFQTLTVDGVADAPGATG